MKKVIAIILCMICLVAVLTGCETSYKKFKPLPIKPPIILFQSSLH